MWVQFKYAQRDIKQNWVSFLLTCVQILVSLILAALVLKIFFGVNDFKKQLTAMSGFEETYFLLDKTDDDFLSANLFGKSDAADRLLEFYQYLTKNPNFKSYTHYSNSVVLDTLFPGIGTEDNENYWYDALYVNQNFVDEFDLQTVSGTMFNADNYNSSNTIVPIVLGNDFIKYLKIGDLIKDGITGQTYKVIGFLPKEAFYIFPKASGTIEFLNKTILYSYSN